MKSILGVVVLLLLSACGDGDNASNNGNNAKNNTSNNASNNANNGTGPYVDVPEADAKATFVKVFCDQERECQCPILDSYTEFVNCEQTVSSNWDRTKTMTGQTYDGECLAQHLNALLAGGCNAAFFDPASEPLCDSAYPRCQVYSGDVSDGETCFGVRTFSDCAKGSFCTGSLGIADPICVEECDAPVRSQGQRCNYGFEILACDADTFCDPVSLFCSPRKAAGMSCDARQDQNEQCVTGLVCGRNAQQMLECMTPHLEGEACVEPNDCESGHCVQNLCAPTPAVGEPCTGRCQDSACVQQTCTAFPGDGEACLTVLPQRCADGLVCDNLSQLCAAQPGDGEACDAIPCSGDGIYCLCDDDTCATKSCGSLLPRVCQFNGGTLF